jgi:hypothetical protein
MQDNAALRRRLKAAPKAAHSPAQIPKPGAAGLQARSSHAAQLGPDPRRTVYHPTLPVSGALPSLSPARAMRAQHAPVSMNCDCRAFAAVPRGAPLPAVEAERTAPPPSLVDRSASSDLQQIGLARAVAYTVALVQPDHTAAAGSPY